MENFSENFHWKLFSLRIFTEIDTRFSVKMEKKSVKIFSENIFSVKIFTENLAKVDAKDFQWKFQLKIFTETGPWETNFFKVPFQFPHGKYGHQVIDRIVRIQDHLKNNWTLWKMISK